MTEQTEAAAPRKRGGPRGPRGPRKKRRHLGLKSFEEFKAMTATLKDYAEGRGSLDLVLLAMVTALHEFAVADAERPEGDG